MVERTQDEYLDLLRSQVRHLTNSSVAFDDGDRSEYVRLATTMRVLLHDTVRSTSLLTHAGLKSDFWLLDTADEYRPENVYATTALVAKSMNGDPLFIPPLLSKFVQPCKCNRARCRGKRLTRDGPPLWRSPQQWMNRVVLAAPGGSVELTAWDLVLNVANKEGGAHVDQTLPAAYHDVSRENAIGLRHAKTGADSFELHMGCVTAGEAAEDPVPATIRQLAFEVAWSLHARCGFDEPEWDPELSQYGGVLGSFYASPDAPFLPANRVTVAPNDSPKLRPTPSAGDHNIITAKMSSWQIVDPRPKFGPYPVREIRTVEGQGMGPC